MKIQTVGHACMVIRDDDGSPILLTDPWLVGSAYWRSWWLQNYPTEAELADLATTQYVYVTHEHTDHFHPYSIKRLGQGPTYCFPALPQEQMGHYLDSIGYKTDVLQPLAWHRLHPKVAVLSIPLPNDDSVLLIDTPDAFIVNMNDSKPMKYQIKRVRQFIDAHAAGKKVILLSSYSPASPVNSFRKDSKIVSMKDKKDYVARCCELSGLVKADFFMPFASQIILYREDSKWANPYRVSLDDLRSNWTAQDTTLCMPYSTIDFQSWTHVSVPESAYQRDEASIIEKVNAQAAKEKAAVFTPEDRENLRQKLRFSRLIMPLLFRKGIGFHVDGQEFTFKPWGGKMLDGIQNPSFSLMMPGQALKDVHESGHFADLGITMFTLIILNGKTNPKMVYLFFLLIGLHDYHHWWSWGNLWKWFKTSLRLNRWKIPELRPA
jgi:hypothetical protein